MKVSVVIPSRNERFLANTINEALTKARGEVEVIAVLDGYWPDPPLPNYPNLVVLHKTTPQGMRKAINDGIAIAKGEYILKLDAHILLGEGYDEILKADCDKDWMVIPRRYSLDYSNWAIDQGRPYVDYEFLKWPWHEPGNLQMSGTVWGDRRSKNANLKVDDNMSFQGSAWFTPKEFIVRLGGLVEEGYGTFISEAQDIGNRIWLSGGKVMTNKNTYYAHLHKGKEFGRGYHLNNAECVRGHHYCVQYWLGNKWPGQIRPFSWLIEHFAPVPTWPDGWEDIAQEKLHSDPMLKEWW